MKNSSQQTSSTSTQPLTNQPVGSSSQSTSPQSKKLAVIAAIFIILIVMGAGGYLLRARINQTSQQLDTNKIPAQTSQVIQPTSQPSINTNIPTANINTLKGKLLYRDADQILVSNVDGSNQMRLIDSKNKVGFAGSSDDGRIVYYTELIGTISTLYKKVLTSGVTTKLFSYDSKEKNIETHFWNVQVSNDGKYAVYSHSDGDLSLYDLNTKTNKKILNQKECLSYNKQNQFGLVKPAYAGAPDCYGYYYPHWSPNNQRVIATKIFYEGGTQVIVNPFDDPVIEKDIKGGVSPEWSSDSNMLVIPGVGYGSGSLYFIANPDNPVKKDLLVNSNEFKNSSVTSGALSKDNKIAFVYSIYDQKNIVQQYGIALYDLNTESIKSLISLLSSYDKVSVELWLDNNTLLYRDGQDVWSLNINTLTKTQLPIKGNSSYYPLELIEVVQ